MLVLLSLVMITLYFREPTTGGMHELQGAGARALEPFQVAADRVARPFRDVYGYFSGLVHAKSENERLREEVDRLRQQLILNETARQDAARLAALLNFRAPPSFPADVDFIAATVTAHAPAGLEQQVVISAGRDDGVQKDDPVVNGDGLVGRVTNVTRTTAQVTLLTDESSAVSAVDIDDRSDASGLIQNGGPGADGLILDGVDKSAIVSRGDEIVTEGAKRGELPSLYPRGIPIGKVTYVNQTDTDPYKRIQVEPFVDFDSIDAVLVLVAKRPRAGGP